MMTGEHRAADIWVGGVGRAAADRELVEAVRRAGPGSPVAKELEDQLVRYAIRTLVSLFRSGRLPQALKERGRPGPYPTHGYMDEELSLINESIAKSLPRFMSASVFGGGWRPDGGASIRTYFLNTCLLDLADVYRRFVRQQTARLNAELSFEMDDVFVWSSSTVDPAERVAAGAMLAEAVAQLSDRERDVVVRVAEGMPLVGVAQELGLAVGTVKAYLNTARRRLRQWRDAEGSDRSISEAIDPAVTTALWERLALWGVNTPAEAASVRRVIDQQRAVYENPERSALYRPIKSDNRNQLDIILDGMISEAAPENRSKWTADSARVCREVLARIQEMVPSVRRPEGRRKGSSEDLRELYRSVRTATVGDATSR